MGLKKSLWRAPLKNIRGPLMGFYEPNGATSSPTGPHWLLKDPLKTLMGPYWLLKGPKAKRPVGR